MANSENITESYLGTIKIVKYNKPAKKNAIDVHMYVKVKEIFDSAAHDENISMIVLTGAGDYYSSGNDFTAALETPKYNISNILKEYITAFIKFPKILIAVVNGPAIGIAATTLALCDLVFASENSYFYTPFTKLGIVAEGCSTFTFPRLIGERKAAEMLLYNHKMSAKEALDCGFINYIYKTEELQSKVWDKIVEVSKTPQHSLTITKKLLRNSYHNDLLSANAKEIEELNKIWNKGNEYILEVFNKKSKL
ncbi:enoyl-CoA delta isomerase 2, mitochondrial [Bombyx mandarina]|uniref:Enoyl-CoA delta isomerase 2, mitochondrial n=2 Tax=Bombyx TaxID=7090 RepID=A0A8R2ARG0_BOMMO|nr:enoyl-CoA delta isomerase 2 [Bombyx mori]XP_028031123.1 enoyl-CoA delta isomerase 2, mitochondrial [Bombyx mandarina]